VGKLPLKKLEKLFIEILAYAENDWEITLSGNGTNASEAVNVVYAVLDILENGGRKWHKANQYKISQRAKILRKEFGDPA